MKQLIRRMIRTIGYDIVRFKPNQLGRNPFDDMKTFLNNKNNPVVFDVGANVGQSIRLFRSYIPNSTLYSFEPSPATFEKLSAAVGDLDNVHLWNCGVGAAPGTTILLENSQSVMTSFLPLGECGWGDIIKKTPVEVTTIDAFCRDNRVEKIDILKSDTQGFEFEVLKGAEEMMCDSKISLIFLEVIFSDQYRDIASFGQTYQFLQKCGFVLVSFYQFYYQKQVASWTDAVFVHTSMLSKQ